MDIDQNKKQVLEDFDVAQAKQAEIIRHTESRGKSRKTRFARYFACAIVGGTFGWFAFIICKIFHLSGFVYVPIAAVCGAGLALVYTIQQERVHREESAQIHRVISLSGFKKNYDRAGLRAMLIFGSYFALICVGVPLIENNYPHWPISRFIARNFFYVLGSGFASILAVFYVSHTKLHNVQCPQCSNRLGVRSSRPELKDTYSGLCKTCGILWDLDVSNTSTD